MGHSGFRISPQQRQIWALGRNGGDAAYRVCGEIALDGELDVARLDAALLRLVERYEILRTRIRPTGAGEPVQAIGAARPPTRADHDLRALPPAEQAARVAALLDDLGAGGSDAAHETPLRVALAQLGARRHALLFALPALMADAPTAGILARELARAYAADADAPPDDAPQYADLAEFLNDLLESDETEAGRRYWREQDPAAQAALRLPLERASAPPARFAPQVCAADLPAPLAAQLAQDDSVAPWLLACWQALLARIAGAPELTIGVMQDGRADADLAAAPGPLARYTPLRRRVDLRAPLAELARRNRADLAEAARRQEYFAWDPPRSDRPDLPPFFPFCFDIVAAPPAAEAAGVTFALRRVAACVDRFKARLVCLAGAQGLALELHYDAGLFDAHAAQRMLAMLLALIADVAARPHAPLGDLEIIDAAQRSQLLDLAGGEAADPADLRIHRLFELQAARTPDAVALVFDAPTKGEGRRTKDESPRPSWPVHLTYEALNMWANRLARHLRRMGAGPEARVGIRMERSIELIVAVLGVLKSGSAYIPIDPAYPAERARFMLEDSGATAIVTKDEGRRTKADSDRSFVFRLSSLVDLRADWPAIAAEPGGDLDGGADGDNLAYVIYTSGSTGQPKGVLTRHRSVAHYWAALRERVYGGRAGERLRATLNAPLAFDASVKQIALLLGGHTLWIVPEDLRRDGQALLAGLRRARLDVLDCTPSLLRALTAAGLLDAAARAPGVILLGGEPIDDALWQQICSQRDITFFNHYGPTECTVNATIARVDGRMGAPALGRPIASTQIYLLDRGMRLAPLGAPGEVCIGGAGLARGYLGCPDLTAAAFVPNPFAEVGSMQSPAGSEPTIDDRRLPTADCRLYKTGDLARWRADGSLEFLGRIDDQVKIRGYRIEPGEVAAALAQHPAVRACAVVAREDSPPASGRPARRLVAYVVQGSGVSGQGPGGAASDDLSPDPRSLIPALRAWLAARLPEYMVPAAFVALDALPLTPNGKIDRRALPAPRPDHDQAGPPAAPRTPAERTLARIWAELLRVDQVGRDDDFFALGGDSLLAIQVVVRAGQAGLRITPRQLFERPTVAGLADLAEATPAFQTIDHAESGALPLTPIQRWFFEQDLPDPRAWSQAIALDLRRPLFPAALARALRALAERHDALRLRFAHAGGAWIQSLGNPSAPLRLVDLSALPGERRSGALDELAAGLRAALRLETGPLLVAALAELGDGRPARLLLAAHALAADGFSYRLLAEDLQAIYRRVAAGERPDTAPAASFARWAERLAEYARSEDLRREAGYWLAEPDPPLLAPLPDLPDAAPGSARHVAAALDADETRALLRGPTDAALLAALGRVFAAWLGAGALLVDLRRHGRSAPFDDLDPSYTVGWLTAIFPLALRLDPAAAPAETLRAVRAQLGQVPGQGLGYGALRYLSHDADLAGRLRARPQAQVSLNYLGQTDRVAGADALFDVATGPAGGLWSPRYLVEVQAQVAGERLWLLWKYDQRQRRATAEGLAQRCLAELRALIAADAPAARTPDDFPLANLSQRDLRHVIAKVSKAKK